MDALGLVYLDDGWLVAVPYDHAVTALLTRQNQILERATAQVREIQWRLHLLVREGAWLSGDSAGTVLAMSATENTNPEVHFTGTQARADLAVLHPGTRFSQGILDASLRRAELDLANGVQMRAIHQTATLSHHPSATYLRQVEQLGVQVRVRTSLPFRLMLIDGQAAVCSIRWRDAVEETLLLQGSRLVGLFTQLFESMWIDSAPLASAPGAAQFEDRSGLAPLDEARLSGEHLAIMRHLAEGATDQNIARALGVTTRTVTRRVNEIYTALGARSRFEAGATARRLGLI
ncbi:MAG TPA: LuxR C-terminal-related transcriptional regulator [Rugosimonospora sp.]|nr:LuxR C-terminal-related transcriptional regulator [Rugosimonospora sp.]